MNESATGKKTLSTPLRYLYGLGDGGFASMTMLNMQYFAAFLTDYAKFDLAMAALIITVCNTIDMIAAPFSGVFIERSNMKWGKFRSWLFIGPPIVFVFNTLQYSRLGPETVAAVIIVIGSAVARTLWNVVYTANMSMITKITDNPEERNLLAARRSQYQYGFRLLFSMFGVAMIGAFVAMSGNGAMGVTITALLLGLLFMVGYWLTFKLTDGYDEKVVETGTVKAKASMGDMLKVIVKTPPLIILIIADLFRCSGIFILATVTFYYFRVVQGGLGELTIYLTATSVLSFLSSLVAKQLITKFGKKTAFISGPIAASTVLIIAYFAASSGYIFIFLVCLSSLFTSLGQTVFVLLYADCAVYAEWKTGVDARGFIMGLCNLPIKIAALAAGIIVTSGLAYLGYSADAQASETVINGINAIACLGPVIVYILALLVMVPFYRLTPEKLTQISAEIAARKAV